MTAGPLAERFSPDLQHPEALIVPTVVQYELYKWICRERDEMTALAVIDITRQCQVIPLDTSLALLAAGLARQYQLSVADAIIYATARQEAVELLTSDNHFENLPGVCYFPKLGQTS